MKDFEEENQSTLTQKAKAENSPTEENKKRITLVSTFGVELGPFLGLVCPVCRPQRLPEKILSSSSSLKKL